MRIDHLEIYRGHFRIIIYNMLWVLTSHANKRLIRIHPSFFMSSQFYDDLAPLHFFLSSEVLVLASTGIAQCNPTPKHIWNRLHLGYAYSSVISRKNKSCVNTGSAWGQHWSTARLRLHLKGWEMAKILLAIDTPNPCWGHDHAAPNPQ